MTINPKICFGPVLRKVKVLLDLIARLQPEEIGALTNLEHVFEMRRSRLNLCARRLQFRVGQ